MLRLAVLAPASERLMKLLEQSRGEWEMDYLYFGAAILASFHALTYGLWEKQQGNPAGARFVYALAALCVLLPLYRIMAGP